MAKSVPPLALCAPPWAAVDEIMSTVDVRYRPCLCEISKANLEGSSHAEDSVVCFLWWETLDGQKNDLGFLGDQIIGPENGQHYAGYHISNPHYAIGDSCCPYLKPSDLYPAALLYQLAIGVNQVLSHGRLMTKLTRDGCDIVVGCVCGCGL